MPLDATRVHDRDVMPWQQLVVPILNEPVAVRSENELDGPVEKGHILGSELKLRIAEPANSIV